MFKTFKGLCSDNPQILYEAEEISSKLLTLSQTFFYQRMKITPLQFHAKKRCKLNNGLWFTDYMFVSNGQNTGRGGYIGP